MPVAKEYRHALGRQDIREGSGEETAGRHGSSGAAGSRYGDFSSTSGGVRCECCDCRIGSVALAGVVGACKGLSRFGGTARPVYAWFTEGFDTADLKEAKTLLNELTEPAVAAEG